MMVTEKASPISTKSSASKKVTLKLKVKDTDLKDGKHRRRTSLASTTTSATAPGSTRGRVNKRGRPRNIKASTRKNILNVGYEVNEDESQNPGENNHDFSHLAFGSVSALSFPILVTTKAPSTEQLNQRNTQSSTPPQPKQCACCGTTQTHQSSRSYSYPHPHPHPATPCPSSPSIHTRWSDLNIRPTRHINCDTKSTHELLITRSGRLPITVAFWYDMMIAEQAMRSDDVDFKMLCLHLIRWRSWHDTTEEVARFWTQEMVRVLVNSADFGRESSSFVDGDVYMTPWDQILAESVVVGREWRKRRRRRSREGEDNAVWVVGEVRQWRGSRGEFVVDEKGAWVVRAPGDDGEVRRVLRLGYKREGRATTSKKSDAIDLNVGQAQPKDDIGIDGGVVIRNIDEPEM